MIVYGTTTNTSVGKLFVAGIIPGLLLGGALNVSSPSGGRGAMAGRVASASTARRSSQRSRKRCRR